MTWWVVAPTLYLGIGFVWSVYLYHACRIEGDWAEVAFHTVTWPLDLACWVESKLRA